MHIFRNWLKGAIALIALLGLTWTFGLLWLDQQSIAMAYLFTILNSLQGLFIFLFHVAFNDLVYCVIRYIPLKKSYNYQKKNFFR